ncbi:hypothetical protein PYCC9005_002647 [Savitreella phatthalungensis]
MGRKRDRSITPPSSLKHVKLETSPKTKAEAAAKAADDPVTDVVTHSGDVPEGWMRLKIISWNCDGLMKYVAKPRKPLDAFFDRHRGRESPPEEPSFLRNFIDTHQPDILFLQETHMNKEDWQKVQKRLFRDAPGYCAEVCLPMSGRRLAGVLSLWRESLPVTSTGETVTWDGEGRVHMLELPNVWLVNCYALNSSENLYRDPWSGEQKMRRSERKREFQRQLRQHLDGFGKAWILAGDLNIARTQLDSYPGLRVSRPHDLNRQEFNELFDDDSTRDFIRELYPTEKKFTWHGYGEPMLDQARVDMILGSKSSSGTFAGYELLGGDTMEKVDRGESDHSPMYCIIETCY